MTSRRGILFVLTVTLLTLVGEPARGDTLYGVTWNTQQFITINTTTGAGTVVGSLNAGVTPIGLGAWAGNFYIWDFNSSSLLQLDTATGATVATINIGAVGNFGEGDLAFRSDGIGFVGGAPLGPLTSFNMTTATNTAIAGLKPNMDGLAFNGANVLYGLSESSGTPGDDPTPTL
jgi:hypothetical protein